MACCLRSMACCCLTTAGLCFATWMGCRFQNSKGWKALFCNVDGVRVSKQPPTGMGLQKPTPHENIQLSPQGRVSGLLPSAISPKPRGRVSRLLPLVIDQTWSPGSLTFSTLLKIQLPTSGTVSSTVSGPSNATQRFWSARYTSQSFSLP